MSASSNEMHGFPTSVYEGCYNIISDYKWDVNAESKFDSDLEYYDKIDSNCHFLGRGDGSMSASSYEGADNESPSLYRGNGSVSDSQDDVDQDAINQVAEASDNNDTPVAVNQDVVNGIGGNNGHSHIGNSKGEICCIDDEDIEIVCTHFNKLPTRTKTQKWSEAELFRYDGKYRIILRAEYKNFIPEIIMTKYLAQKEIRKHVNNQKTLKKIMKRVTDLVNACCRPSAESRLHSESRVQAYNDRFDVDEILPSNNGIMILMAIWSKALLRMRDEILRIRNSSIEHYDGKTMDDIIRDMELDNVLRRGHFLRGRVPKRAKRRIMELDGINADEYEHSHLRRRVGSFDHEHILFKPHEVEVVKAELEERMRAHRIQALANSEGGGNCHPRNIKNKKRKFSDSYTPGYRNQNTANVERGGNGHSHIRNSKGEICCIDDEDIEIVCTHFNKLPTRTKTQKWSEAELFRYDGKYRIILRAEYKNFIPEIIMTKYLTQKESQEKTKENKISIHVNNQKTLHKIMKRVTDLVNACCRPSAESRLHSESRVQAYNDRFDVDEILPSNNGIMILMAIWSKALLRMRDEILRIRNSSIEHYDGKTMDDIIRDMGCSRVLPRGHFLRGRVPKRAKRRIMELDGINADEYEHSHLRRRVGSFDHEHILFKPHEVEVVKAELEERMRAHRISTTSPG